MIKMEKRHSRDERFDKVFVYDISGNTLDPDIDKYFKEEVKQYKRFFKFMVVWCNEEARNFEFEYYHNLEELLSYYKTYQKFTKAERSSFKYWFSHWSAFQLTALNLRIWKPKYLFHDFEKPWLKLLWRGNYKKVQKWHRLHNKHHLEYGLRKGWNKVDWEALMIDWECSRLSKQEGQLDARETMIYEIEKDKWKPYSDEIINHLLPLLNKYQL